LFSGLAGLIRHVCDVQADREIIDPEWLTAMTQLPTALV